MGQRLRWYGLSFVSLILGLVSSAQAISTEFYVALDGLQTITSGVYAGLANPNAQRLTYLFAHPDPANPSTNHFHAIGAYSYTGPASSPTILSSNSNNRIPETFTGQPPLPLVAGTGNQAGHLVSQAIPGLEYSDLTIASIQALAGFAPNTPEWFLFNSSGGRWISPLTEAEIALELVAISPGLQLADSTGSVLLSQPGERYSLGAGDTLAFTPVFVVEAATASAGSTYSATLRLVDVSTASGHVPFLESGTFNLDFVATPEPSTLALLSLGCGALAWLARRRRLAGR
ncbi:MAG: all3515 family Zur-repressed PEP-CTERM protein [Candidatus Tectimicrobiota bacterium]